MEAAQIFERESRTTPDVNLAAITDRTDIRKAVQEGDLQTAIARVNDLSPEVGPPDCPCFLGGQGVKAHDMIWVVFSTGENEAKLLFSQQSPEALR